MKDVELLLIWYGRTGSPWETLRPVESLRRDDRSSKGTWFKGFVVSLLSSFGFTVSTMSICIVDRDPIEFVHQKVHLGPLSVCVLSMSDREQIPTHVKGLPYGVRTNVVGFLLLT